MNGEQTAPLPAVVVTDAEQLIAISERVLAVLEENRRLALMAISAHPDEAAVIANDMRLADLQGDYRDGIKRIRAAAVARSARDITLEETAVLSAVPDGPRHRRTRGRVPRPRAPGPPLLNSVKGYAPAAAAVAFLRPLGKAARHVIAHPAAIRLTAHTARVAAGAAMGAGAAAAVTVIALTPSVTQGQHGASAGAGAALPGWHTSATPFPSSSPAALLLTKPKPKHSARGKTLLYAAAQPPYSPAAQDPASSPAGASASSAASAAAGPATLTVSTQAIDLTTATSAVITLSASGSGWLTWRVDTKDPATGLVQDDLDFSKTSGVLQAGQEAYVTVSVDQVQASDGNTSETFTIGGISVTATLPAPVPAVTPPAIPSAGVTADPTTAPSDAPSPGPS